MPPICQFLKMQSSTSYPLDALQEFKQFLLEAKSKLYLFSNPNNGNNSKKIKSTTAQSQVIGVNNTNDQYYRSVHSISYTSK